MNGFLLVVTVFDTFAFIKRVHQSYRTHLLVIFKVLIKSRFIHYRRLNFIPLYMFTLIFFVHLTIYSIRDFNK